MLSVSYGPEHAEATPVGRRGGAATHQSAAVPSSSSDQTNRQTVGAPLRAAACSAGLSWMRRSWRSHTTVGPSSVGIVGALLALAGLVPCFCLAPRRFPAPSGLVSVARRTKPNPMATLHKTTLCTAN